MVSFVAVSPMQEPRPLRRRIVQEDLQWLVSVDDHLIEPPDVWVKRASAKDRDRVPHVERIDGVDIWVYEHFRATVMGILVAAHQSPDQYSPKPVNYDDLSPAYFDPHERIADMDADGVIAALNFPFFARFCGQTFSEVKDRELGLKCLKAYNDYVLDEWCAAAPGRYIPLVIVPLYDQDLAIEEVHRTAAKGAKAVTFSENLHPLGFPSIHSGEWDKFFAAVCEAKMPLCTHIGSSSSIPTTSPDAPFGVGAVNINLNLANSTTDWLFSGKLQQFPDLKIVLSEGGIGWIPFVLERAEHVATQYQYLRGNNWSMDPGTGVMAEVPAPHDQFPASPRALFREHMYGCFIEDEFGAANIDYIGVDNVMIETDYPHTDSLWPNSVQMAHKMLAHLSDADKYKVLQGNARRVFNFEPAPYPQKRAG
jgi:predicted TIM-barrel fold metal-dependent hydrolase